MGYWKSKVVPKLKQVFEMKGPSKKAAAAAEECKIFDKSKEEISKQIEEKKEELNGKVLEIYQGCSAEIKAILKAPTEAGLKKHSSLVKKFLADLIKIEFPGSKQASEAAVKYGLSRVSTCVLFVVEKVSTFIPLEPEAPAVEVEVTAKDVLVPPPTEETPAVVVTEKEVVEKIEEVVVENKEETTTTKPEETVAEVSPAVGEIAKEEPVKA